jgi:hypothetical protein
VTLAYVFWHWPGVADGYEERMQAFHDALDRPGTATYRLERAPWETSRPGPYEDWYPVEDWGTVGELNDRAVTGPRKEPHDVVAAMSEAGTGSIYRLIEGGVPFAEVAFAAWSLMRPEPLPAGAALWQRQLALGPAPEYAVLAPSPVPVADGAAITGPRLVARSRSS